MRRVVIGGGVWWVHAGTLLHQPQHITCGDTPPPTTKKLSDVEFDREELSTKFDETNQTIGALRFENNFLAEKTKKLEAELVQVRAQLERLMRCLAFRNLLLMEPV